jgi:hypothetical protein
MVIQEGMMPRGIIDNPNMGDPIGGGRPGGSQAIGAVAAEPDIPDKGDAQLIDIGGAKRTTTTGDDYASQMDALKEEKHAVMEDEDLLRSRSAMAGYRAARNMPSLHEDPSYWRLVNTISGKIKAKWREQYPAAMGEEGEAMTPAIIKMAHILAHGTYAQATYDADPKDEVWKNNGVFIKG